MTQSQILNANFDWLQVGKKEHFPEYKIQTQKTMRDRIAKAKRSSFDLSKFSIYGSPLLTDDGILTNTTNDNCLAYKNGAINPELKDFHFELEFEKLQDYPTSAYIPIGGANDIRRGNFQLYVYNNQIILTIFFDNNGEITRKETGIITPITNSKHKCSFERKGSLFTVKYDNQVKTFESSLPVANATTQNIGRTQNGQYNKIDLKSFSFTIDGVEVFNGNKTGADQVTSTLQIPYTQSKTGEKIVDATYRDRVEQMYNDYGYTHYYTLGDNDYTLATVPNEKIVDSYYADNSFMELTADLTLTQGGGAISGQTVNLKRPYKDNKYISTIGTSSKATNGFVASASGQWITKGKGVLG